MRQLPKINTLVIKIGSSIIAGDDDINKQFLSELGLVISNLKKEIHDIIIVSSGAIAAGFKHSWFFDKTKRYY